MAAAAMAWTLAAPFPVQAQSGWAAGLPPAVWAPLEAAGVPPDAVSMLVLPVDAPQPRLEHDAQAVRQVASVMKLFTTGAALDLLGPAYSWRTEVLLGGPVNRKGLLQGPLYIRASGDPSLVLERVQLWMSRWRAAGLRDIAGDIVIDRSAFHVPPHDPAAFDAEPLKPYNAGPDALLLNHGAVSLRFMPDVTDPGRVRVAMEPELDHVQIDARITPQATVPCGDWREAMDLQIGPQRTWRPQSPGSPRRWVMSVRGPYPAACGTRAWPVLWPGADANDYAARLLGLTWKRLGGTLRGRVTDGQVPAGTPVWQVWESPPLAEVLRDINKFSNNVMARQLFLSLPPRDGSNAATLDGARDAVAQHVRARTLPARGGASPCEGAALVLDNGSGLSRIERSTAACLGRWMQAVWRSPVMPEFVGSLPIAGTDGTARRLTSVAGRAHLKTGSLDGVAALAGYVEGESGRRYVVVGIINHPQADAARPALEALVAWAVRDGADQN